MQGMFIFICSRSFRRKDGTTSTTVFLFDPDQNDVSNYMVDFDFPDFKFGEAVIAKMHLVRVPNNTFVVLDALDPAKEVKK